MNATILLGTLKKTEPSNTEVLCEFLASRLRAQGIETEIVRLVDHAILPGTYRDMGQGDQWPQIQDKLEASDIIVFATPVWWNSHSSEMQRVIERLDEVHDEILAGKASRLSGKVGGIVVTGDSDGAESLIGNIANFYNAIGIDFPAFATLTVLGQEHTKGKSASREELLAKYEKEYGAAADTMVRQLAKGTNAS